MKICLIGYGEVGRILAEDLGKQGLKIIACDIKLVTAAGDPLREHADRLGVRLTSSHTEAVSGADLIISAVTASQTVAVARACAEGIARNTKDAERFKSPLMQGIGAPGTCHYLDFNSASPGAKIQASEIVQQAGGRYVEAAIMTSFPPHRIKVPMLLGGPWASELATQLEALGFAPGLSGKALGVASATKMSRSIMIKGLEAMVIESLTTARAHGVEEQVLASLHETFPGVDWEKQATYFFQRVIEHGRRRSEEMYEAARTVQEAGIKPWSAEGTAERQGWMADLSDMGVFGTRDSGGFARSTDWRVEADRILAHMKSSRTLPD